MLSGNNNVSIFAEDSMTNAGDHPSSPRGSAAGGNPFYSVNAQQQAPPTQASNPFIRGGGVSPITPAIAAFTQLPASASAVANMGGSRRDRDTDQLRNVDRVNQHHPAVAALAINNSGSAFGSGGQLRSRAPAIVAPARSAANASQLRNQLSAMELRNAAASAHMAANPIPAQLLTTRVMPQHTAGKAGVPLTRSHVVTRHACEVKADGTLGACAFCRRTVSDIATCEAFAEVLQATWPDQTAPNVVEMNAVPPPVAAVNATRSMRGCLWTTHQFMLNSSGDIGPCVMCRVQFSDIAGCVENA